jgi:anti-anti-sigma factor
MLKVYRKQLGDVAVLCLQGGIVIGEITALRDAVLSQSEAISWILDLTRVSRIDARGLGLLLELREQTLARGQEFKLRNVNRLVRHVFEITHLNFISFYMELNASRADLSVATSQRHKRICCHFE